MQPEKTIKTQYAMPPWKRAVTGILYTGYRISDRLNELLKPFGLSEQQLNVLYILGKKSDQGCNLCDVQGKMMHKMSNATRLVEKLRMKGLVTREIDEDNRRKVEITITAKGLKLLEKVEEKLKTYHQEFYENKLSEAEFNLLADLLEKLGK